VNFTEIRRSSLNFKIDNVTVPGFKIFKKIKKYVKKTRINFEQTGEDIFSKMTSFSLLNFKFT
jgi:hypothetical protein